MRMVRLCVVLLASGWLAPAFAQDTQIGDWVFTLPEGMAVRSVRDGRPWLAFRNTPDNLSTTVILAESADLRGEDPKVAFAAWAEEGREALRRELKIETAGEASESETPQAYDQIAWIATYTDQRSVDWVTLLVCLRHGRRAGGLMLFTNDFERLGEAAQSLDALVASTTFASCRPADVPPPPLKVRIDPTSTPSFLWGSPVEPPAGAGGLAGIYGASGLGAAGDPREGITTARYRWRYYTFFADGSVLRELPPEGLLSFLPRFYASHLEDAFGAYRLTDDAVEMTFPRPGGRPASERLVRRGADLADGGTVYARCVGDGVGLRGAFLRHDWQQLGEVYRKPLAFAEDGTFTDAGLNSTLNIGWWVGGDCTLRDLTAIPGSGTWRVARNTLELLYADGRRRRFAFHLYPGEPAEGPRVIVLNGNVLVRRD